MDQAYIYINYSNIAVLRLYLDIVKTSLEGMGYACTYVHSLEGVDKDSLIVFPMGNDAFKFYLKGFHNIILWQQGVTGEESFLRHKSWLRRKILNFFDCFIMKHARYIFYVSEALRDYYERISKRSFKSKSYIMPCFNEKFNPALLKEKDYAQKTFAYVGSLSVWQCFDETIAFYKKIEELNEDAHLLVLTFEVEKALNKLKEYEVKSFEVKSVPPEMVRNELMGVSYGFILRKDIVVNRVATPTKISSYLAAGVLPIFSDCVLDFQRINQAYHVGVDINSDKTESIEKVMRFVSEKKDTAQIIKNIDEVFSSYYSVEFHVNRIVDELSKVLDRKEER